MPTCAFCNQENPPSAERCQNCGAWLAEHAAGAAPAEGDPSTDEAGADHASLEQRMLSLMEQGSKIETIKLYRERTGAGLDEAKDAVERLARSRAYPEGALEGRVLSLLERGEKIPAIKLYREETGAGLKQAKDAVEALASKHGIPVRGSGCAGAVVFALAWLVTLACSPWVSGCR